MVPDVRRDSAERWTYGAGAPWVALSTEGRGPALERAPRREAGGHRVASRHIIHLCHSFVTARVWLATKRHSARDKLFGVTDDIRTENAG